MLIDFADQNYRTFARKSFHLGTSTFPLPFSLPPSERGVLRFDDDISASIIFYFRVPRTIH